MATQRRVDEPERILWTPAAEGDLTEAARRDASLSIMREHMLTETEPHAAVFAGGMDGIHDEWLLFERLRPGGRRYPFGAPGGAARDLAIGLGPSRLRELLVDGLVFPAVARAILADLG